MTATSPAAPGRFITIEGIDGAGKTSHIAALVTRFQAQGVEVVSTREPGGTPLAESLRDLLLHRAMDPLAESLLAFAARRDHVLQVIQPALARGATVVCDRFTDATFAYQGGGRGVAHERLQQLEHWVHGALQPALTLWFDLPAATAAERRAAARAPDRFEQQDLAFFTQVREAYARRAASAPQRVARIDAAPAPAQVWQQIVAVLVERGW